VVPQGLVLSLLFPILVIFGALACDFLVGVLRAFSWGFLLGVMYEDLVPLWLVTLPQESFELTSIWWFFELLKFLT
jgi:hypothetical protein